MTDTGGSTPAANRTAYNDENADGVVETLHPDPPEQISADIIGFRGTVTVESVTVTDGSRTITERHDYELRRHEACRAIWSFRTGWSDETATPTT